MAAELARPRRTVQPCWSCAGTWGNAAGRWREESGLHERAWHWVASVDPDLALLQETEPPGWVQERWDLLTLSHRFWASSLMTQRGTRMTPAALPVGGVIERAGSYHATAEIELADGAQLLVASVHASPNEAPRWGHPEYRRAEIARTSVGTPCCNDVAFAGYRDLADGRRFLLAGDWNTSRWLDADGVPAADGQELFDRAEAAGWTEISLDEHGREGKTWYGSSNPRFSQLDHVFADEQTAATAREFRIDPHPVETLGLSDHAPMFLEVDLNLASRAGEPEADTP